MEDITLEKIDIIRQRTGLGYAAAKEALENNNWDVVETLIYIEKNQKTFGQNISDATNDLIETIKDIINKGNVARIKVKKDNRILIDIPVNAGIAAGTLTLFYPPLLVIGAATAILSKVTIEVERPDGKVDIINDIVKEGYENVKEKAQNIANKAEQAINKNTSGQETYCDETGAENKENNE